MLYDAFGRILWSHGSAIHIPQGDWASDDKRSHALVWCQETLSGTALDTHDGFHVCFNAYILCFYGQTSSSHLDYDLALYVNIGSALCYFDIVPLVHELNLLGYYDSSDPNELSLSPIGKRIKQRWKTRPRERVHVLCSPHVRQLIDDLRCLYQI